MKTIWLVRHSKSDWGNELLHDFERHLNARGYADANKMSLRLKAKNEIPDAIISSSAIRAMSTAIIFCKNLFGDCSQLKIEDKIYGAGTNELIKIIERTYPLLNNVLFIGHNPTVTNTINALTNAEIANVPTTGVAKITFNTDDWKMIAKGTGNLIYFDFPKNAE